MEKMEWNYSVPHAKNQKQFSMNKNCKFWQMCKETNKLKVLHAYCQQNITYLSSSDQPWPSK
jgi:hypothetical protein